jgi:hypothetical protein
MKSLKLIIINALTLIIGIGLMSGSFSQRDAQAARFETVPALSVGALGNMQGQYLTVLYAVGSRPFISTDASQITLSQVKDAKSVYISADTMAFPSVQVEKEGVRPSYNMVILIVSPQPNFAWVNADGSVPQGVVATGNRQASLMNAMNKSDIDAFIAAKGEAATLTISIKK